MIERIARRAGGFAATTALRWMGAIDEAVPEVQLPHRKKASPLDRLGKPLAGGAVATTVVLLSSNDIVRARVSKGLRKVAEALRTEHSNNGTAGSSQSKNGAMNGSATNGSDRSIAEKSRAELYEMAKKKDIPGRSSMSKQELAKALSRTL